MLETGREWQREARAAVQCRRGRKGRTLRQETLRVVASVTSFSQQFPRFFRAGLQATCFWGHIHALFQGSPLWLRTNLLPTSPSPQHLPPPH